MTTSTERTVWCDWRDETGLPIIDHGCPAWTQHAARTVAVVRAEAAEFGWAHVAASTRHEYDLCPDHAALRPGVDFPNWRAS